MQKQAPTAGRLAVMVMFALSCFGLLLYLWVAFGGSIPLAPKGYRFSTSFGEATQLSKEADVRISGVSVGKVKDIQTQGTGRSRVTIQLQDRYAPIPRNTRAILRQKTLLGETYVELTPGDRSKGMLPDGGTLPVSQVSPTVELDEIFRTFDPKTREAFRTWFQSQAASVRGRGQGINDAFGNLAPFAVDVDALLRVLKSQQADLRGDWEAGRERRPGPEEQQRDRLSLETGVRQPGPRWILRGEIRRLAAHHRVAQTLTRGNDDLVAGAGAAAARGQDGERKEQLGVHGIRESARVSDRLLASRGASISSGR